jgi:hypothetical protein
MTSPPTRTPRFCRHCGAPLPPNQPRYCIECGGEVLRPNQAQPEQPAVVQTPPTPIPTSTPRSVPTVRLGNANVEQSVIGGTTRLPTAGAIPPGLWFQDHPPSASDVIAIYAPLRAVVGGWSGLIGQGWKASPIEPSPRPGNRMLYHFETERVWFPAKGYGQGLHLHVHLHAQAEAQEGRSRRGFRYRTNHDAPMEVVRAWWVDPSTNQRVIKPIPEIQVMAPPRVPRVSDFDETIRTMPAAQAEAWARQGVLPGMFQLARYDMQDRTPAGRGLPLFENSSALTGISRLLGLQQRAPIYRVQVFRPLRISFAEWKRTQPRIKQEAQGLGLDLGTDLVVEWWLDRQGYDSVYFEQARAYLGQARTLIVFRRAQLVLQQ